MIERLKKILAYYDLSASSFADKIDVPRSSISHLLSGRNKPSLDFIIKVEKAFDEVELNWLVYGKGSFPPNIEKPEKKESIENYSTPSLFAENPVFEQDSEEKSNTQFSESHQKSEKVATSKEIKNILVLYNDGTFEDYRKR
ncbi:helix-turn-helix transcriptional regulator [Tenacibaculum tangerinum]|uniref:Helix-turn-helix transcriptional regulator n=1 Tax=Tenacibaculum tangerinum TaxID=3038772 RepID=A0ABY8L490_9FLAO|nr:helix-turn-helix transcriptional regulator [Tenacibaculum tangerinum]WGH76084.1 helix-turn-helix transcriptional regulator [Tenacibaculum tangerinum]